MNVEAGFVNEVRLRVLEIAGRTGVVPDSAAVAGSLHRPPLDVEHAFAELGSSHVYVGEPGDRSRLRMANPFSAVPTAFRVEVGEQSFFGNCVWDALGIISLKGGEGRVLNPCPDCGEMLELRVAGRRLVKGEGVVNFSVPARQWWDDIIHT